MNLGIRTIIAVVTLCLSPRIYAIEDVCDTWIESHFSKVESWATVGWAYAEVYGQANPKGCINGSQDESGISQLYKALQSGKANGNPLSDEQKLEYQVRVFFLIKRDLNFAINSCDEIGVIGCQIVNRQRDFIEELEESTVTSDISYSSKLRIPNNWQFDNDGNQKLSDDNLVDYLNGSACKVDLTSDSCKNALKVTAKLLRASETMIQMASTYNRTIIGQNKAFLSARHSEWDQYFNQVSVQYPWELAINSALYNSDRSDDALARFPQPPNKKLIFLHPSVGFEYIKGPGGESMIAGSVLLEVLGGEFWSWKGGEAKNRWGASAAASFAEISGMDTVGYGLVLHTPIKHASLGVVWRDGNDGSETGFFMNVDLAKLIMEYDDRDLMDFLSK
jgi:hypothetical protein